jgi:MscS family membrane protein
MLCAVPFSAFILILGFYLGFKIIGFSVQKNGLNVNEFLNQAFRIAAASIVIWTFYRLSELISVFLTHRFSEADDVMQKQFIPLITRSIKTFVIIVGLLLIIQNLGYSIGSLLAGLGIGGLAVALAAQDTLANLFSSLMILTDTPFRVGDYIKFDQVEGDVENIGFRTTRVRTLNKSLITIPNKMFMNTAIENFSLRDRRRILINLGVTYDTKPETLNNFVQRIEKLIQTQPQKFHQDGFSVGMSAFQDSSLNIIIDCFTMTTVLADFIKVQHEFCVQLLQLANELKIDYAFPSQSVYWGKQQLHLSINQSYPPRLQDQEGVP